MIAGSEPSTALGLAPAQAVDCHSACMPQYVHFRDPWWMPRGLLQCMWTNAVACATYGCCYRRPHTSSSTLTTACALAVGATAAMTVMSQQQAAAAAVRSSRTSGRSSQQHSTGQITCGTKVLRPFCCCWQHFSSQSNLQQQHRTGPCR